MQIAGPCPRPTGGPGIFIYTSIPYGLQCRWSSDYMLRNADFSFQICAYWDFRRVVSGEENQEGSARVKGQR